MSPEELWKNLKVRKQAEIFLKPELFKNKRYLERIKKSIVNAKFKDVAWNALMDRRGEKHKLFFEFNKENHSIIVTLIQLRKSLEEY